MAKNEKKVEESGIIVKPRFAPDDVIDLSYRHLEALPNRVRIEMVYLKRDSKEWMYDVITETIGKDTHIQMSESFIKERMCNKYASAYKHQFVIQMYRDGYRWAGNFPRFIAKDKAKKLIPLENIFSIVLHDAINNNGNKMDDYYGIWVKYITTISDYGLIITNNPIPTVVPTPIVIK